MPRQCWPLIRQIPTAQRSWQPLTGLCQRHPRHLLHPPRSPRCHKKRSRSPPTPSLPRPPTCSSTAPTPYVAMMTRAGLGLLAVLRSDAAAAEQQCDALRSGTGIMVPSTFMPFIRMVPASFLSTARLLALLAQTSGKLDLSVNHFEDGLLFCRRANYRPELAWTCCDYADLLLQLGAPDQREQARLLLEESLTIAQELGMAPLRQRVTERLDRIRVPEPTPEVYPDGLTRREVDVLRLVASGKSNQEIAEELYINLRTVANHVTNILGKINASNRTEAAIYAARQGLT